MADGAQPPFPTGQFDVVVSGERFEHNPIWAETLRKMVATAREGGVVAFTCASRGRVEHGTRLTSRHDSPGTQAVGWDYYRNVRPEDLEALPLGEWFSSHRSWYLPPSDDLYFCGPPARAPDRTRSRQHLVAVRELGQDGAQAGLQERLVTVRDDDGGRHGTIGVCRTTRAAAALRVRCAA